ncbi:MAG: glycosyltransferase family 2 protein [Patescibacteria group bacterium]|nr:glycosyltransferase family 2 protein [Patescibacteria group bacterium]
MENPVLSICIPTLNRAECLKENLESIVSQFKDRDLFEQVEVVICDNASTDGTASLVESFQKKFSNIKFFRNEKNIGFDRNLLKAVEKSSGEYCLTIGDDDAFFPESFSVIIQKIKTIRAPYLMLNCWGYDHWLKNPVLPFPNHQITQDIVYPNLSDFVKSIKNYMDLVGFFSSMSTQLFFRKAWTNFANKEIFIGTNIVHFFILLNVFKDSRFALLAEPLIKTRNDNLRWDSYTGLETNLKRNRATIKSILWISDFYDLDIPRYRVEAFFLWHSCWVAFKELAKATLRVIGLRK